jgi:hypothetical protein
MALITRDDVRAPAAAAGWSERACLLLEVAEPGRMDLLPLSTARPDHVWRGVDEGVFAYGYRDGTRWWMRWPAVGTFSIRADSPVVTVVPEPGVSRAVLEDAFLRGVRPVALLQREFEVLHASAVATSGGVVALCAVSGTGKSTLAAALAAAGLELWADDFVPMHVTDGGAWSPYFAARSRLDEPSAAAVASIRPIPRSDPMSPPLPTGARLRAVLILHRDATLPVAVALSTPMAPSQAFTKLLPHVHECGLAGGRMRRSLERYLAVAAVVPIIEVRVRSDLSGLPQVAADLVHHLQERQLGGVS